MSEYIEKTFGEELHPWGVISSILSDLTSDEIVKIICLTGLKVDWLLTKEASYSNKTRIRAFLIKIENAYKILSHENKLLVAWIVAKELVNQGDDYRKRLEDALATIGWRLDSGRLTTDNVDIREMFFPKGTEHDAYMEVKKILNKAKDKITIIDPYIDGSIFQMLKSITATKIKVELLSYKLPPDFALEATKFKVQYSHYSLEIKETKEFHDRFIILDDSQCYHIGASIKDAGQKAFMISQIEDNDNVDSLIKQKEKSWCSAKIFNS